MWAEETHTMNKKNTVQNRSASIRTRKDARGNLRTETFRRDDDTVSVAVSTNRNDATRVYIDTPEGIGYTLDGRTARTLYRALQKHYQSSQKTW